VVEDVVEHGEEHGLGVLDVVCVEPLVHCHVCLTQQLGVPDQSVEEVAEFVAKVGDKVADASGILKGGFALGTISLRDTTGLLELKSEGDRMEVDIGIGHRRL